MNNKTTIYVGKIQHTDKSDLVVQLFLYTCFSLHVFVSVVRLLVL